MKSDATGRFSLGVPMEARTMSAICMRIKITFISMASHLALHIVHYISFEVAHLSISEVR